MNLLYPLFSSSKGNSTYFGDENKGLLFDAGGTCKKIVDALSMNNINLSAIKGVFITHEHNDHISALKVLLKKINVPIFSMKKTLDKLVQMDIFPLNYELVQIDNMSINIENYKVIPFKTPHDAVDSCGYIINTSCGKKVSICTDLGEVTPLIEQYILGSEVVLLESNYDENLLQTGPYSPSLKRRISSNFGHLSNVQSAKFAYKLVKNGTKTIILGHLSPENNLPEVAIKTIENALLGEQYTLKIAQPTPCGEMVLI